MTRTGGRAALITMLAALLGLLTPDALGQAGPVRPDRSPAPTVSSLAGEGFSANALRAIADAGTALSGDGASGGSGGAGGEGDGLSVGLNIMLLLTVIALVPSVMLMTTCFVRILIVLGLLRQALGTQSLPPAQVITGLALFMTALVMQPTLDRIWNEAVVPYQNGEIRDYDTLWASGVQPLRDFMFDQIEATDNWSSLYLMLNYRGIDTTDPGSLTRADVPTAALVPAYMLAELKTAFLMGFRVYLPFLVIDLVIASLLISMSMMMLPPILVSVPFKILLFVLVDGWTLVVGSLLESFVTEGASDRLSADPQSAALFMLLPLLCFVRRKDPADPGAAHPPDPTTRGARRPRRERRNRG
ncbi:MAG: flagellar type III secretion system pore protein FliP [Phycisphaerales bacterium JB040]